MGHGSLDCQTVGSTGPLSRRVSRHTCAPFPSPTRGHTTSRRPVVRVQGARTYHWIPNFKTRIYSFIFKTTALGPNSSSPSLFATMVPQKRPSGPGPDHPERSAKHLRIETPTTNDKAISKHDIEPKDDDRLRRLRGLNRSVMSMFEAALEKDPGADLSTLLENYAQVYPDRRKRTEERASKGNIHLEISFIFILAKILISSHDTTPTTRRYNRRVRNRNHQYFLYIKGAQRAKEAQALSRRKAFSSRSSRHFQNNQTPGTFRPCSPHQFKWRRCFN